MKRAILLFAAALLAALSPAQQMDSPVTLPVSYYGQGVITSSGQPWSQFSFGSSLGATSVGSGSYMYGGTMVYSPLKTANVIPGKDYTMQVTSNNFSFVKVHFADVPGYEIYLGATAATNRRNNISYGSNYTLHFRLEAINDVTQSLASERGGAASSLAEDKPIWFVGLGSLRNGRFAGAVGFRQPSFTSDLYRTSALVYDSVDTSEVSVTRGSLGYIESVTSREVKVEVDPYSSTGTQYGIRVKKRNADGTIASTPFVTYTVKKVGSNAGVLIIKSEDGTYEATKLEASGSTWTLYDWRKSDSSGTFTNDSGKRAVSVVSGNTTDVYYGGADALTAPIVKKRKTYANYSWGKELTGVVWGPSDSSPISTSYSYYDSSTGSGWQRSIKSMVEPTGNWTKYDYYNAANDSRGGLVHRIYKPWLDYPTAPDSATTSNCYVETYDYTANFDGSTTAPSSKETKVNNTTVAKTTWTYSWNYGSANGRSLYSKTRRDYSSSGSYLSTTTVSFRPDDSAGFFQNAPHCVSRPDGTRESYAYYYGTWNASSRTFTQSDSGSDRLTLTLRGQSSSGSGTTPVSSWTEGSKTWTLATVHMVQNLSTIGETVTDGAGRQVYEAEYVYTGDHNLTSADRDADRIGGTARSFDSNNLLLKELDVVRSVSGVEVAVNYEHTAGRLKKSSGIDGTATSYSYDSDLRVETVTTADGGSGKYPKVTQSFTYNAADLTATASECSCSPSVTTYHYETTATGRVGHKTEPKPGSATALLTTSYDYVDGRTTKTTLPTGATLERKLHYDGRLKSETGTGRDPAYYSYSVGSYSITERIDGGSGSAYPWAETRKDGLGRVSKVRVPQVGWTTSLSSKAVSKAYSYSPTSGQLTKVATTDDSAGNARLLPDHLYTYGLLGLLASEGDDLGSDGALNAASTDRIKTYSYDYYVDGSYNGWIFRTKTNVYRTDNSSSNVTKVYERRDRLTRFNNGGSLSGSPVIRDVVELDASGRSTVTWEWVSPTARSRTKVVALNGAGTASAVWKDGYLKSETSPTGVARTMEYNSRGLLESVVQATTNAKESYTYYAGTSALHQLTKTTGATSTATSTYEYFWEETDPSVTSAYQTKVTDAASNVSYTEYDLKGRPHRVWGSAAQPAEFGYDSFGRSNEMRTFRSGSFAGPSWPTSPGQGDLTSWTVDPASGLVTAKTYPDSGSVAYSYNARGQVEDRTWARGVVTDYTYHSLTGELMQKSYSDGVTPAVAYSYNRFGALASVTRSGSTRSFAYRSDLKLDYESLGSSYGNRTLTETYDSSVPGRWTGYSFNGSVTVGTAVGYESSGRPNSVTGLSGSSSEAFTLGYQAGTDWVSSVTRGYYSRSMPLESKYNVISKAETKYNGEHRAKFVAKYEDPRGYRNKLENGDASGTPPEPSESWSRMLGLANGYKATLQYDSYGRLDNNTSTPLAWQSGAGTQSLPARNVNLNYDLAGNRSGSNTDKGGTTTYTANEVNEYSAISGAKAEATLTYDDDGNLEEDGEWKYEYDGENRLRQMKRGETETITFDYDYLGRRVKKSINGTDIRYVWHGWTLAAEVASNGSDIRRSFIWGPDFSDDQGAAGGAGALLGHFGATSLVTYAIPDALGNIVGYMSPGGVVQSAREFSPTGEVVHKEGVSFVQHSFGFSGQYTDEETDLVYFGMRYYSPRHGRFLNRDPIEEAGGINLYAITGNAQTRAWDVLGLSCWEESEVDTTMIPGINDDDDPTFYYRLNVTTYCLDDVQHSPTLVSGGYSEPEFERNSGWDRDWRKFDPRKARSEETTDGADLSGFRWEPVGQTPMQSLLNPGPPPGRLVKRDENGSILYEGKVMPRYLGGTAPVGLGRLKPAGTLVKKAFGKGFPTKVNNAGQQQPYNPRNGYFMSHSANPGVKYSPLARFSAGLTSGAIDGASPGPSPDGAVTPIGVAGNVGYYIGYALGKIGSSFQ